MKRLRGQFGATLVVACLATVLIAADNAVQSAASTRTLSALRVQERVSSLLNTDLDPGTTAYRTVRGELIRNLHDLGPDARQTYRYLTLFEDAVKQHAEKRAQLDEQTSNLTRYVNQHAGPSSRLAFLDIQAAVKDYRLYRHLRQTHQACVPGGAILTDIREKLKRLEKHTAKAQRFRIERYRESFEAFVASLHAAESAMNALQRDGAALVSSARRRLDPSRPMARVLEARTREMDWRRERTGWWSPGSPSPLQEIQNLLAKNQTVAHDYLAALDELDGFWRSESRLAFPLIEAHGRTLENAVSSRLHALLAAKRLKLHAKDYMLAQLTGLPAIRAAGSAAPSGAGLIGRWQAALEAVPVGSQARGQQAQDDYRAAFQDLIRVMKQEQRLLERADREARALERRLGSGASQLNAKG